MKKVLALLICVLAALPIRSFSAEDDERSGEQLARAVWQASGGEAWAKVKTIDFTFVVEKRGGTSREQMTKLEPGEPSANDEVFHISLSI